MVLTKHCHAYQILDTAKKAHQGQTRELRLSTVDLLVLALLDLDFVQLGFSLSNGVTDTLEFSSILIYSKKYMSLYTQGIGRMPH